MKTDAIEPNVNLNNVDSTKLNKISSSNVNITSNVTSTVSPDLTPDEILKIKYNLSNCGDFNFMIYTLQEETIMDVYGTLKGEQYKKDAEDPHKNDWSRYLCDALEIVGIASEQPEIEILAIVIGGIVEYVTENSEEASAITQINLNAEFKKELERNKQTYNSITQILNAMHQDPNTYRDKELNITGYKSCVLRDLAKMDIPDKMDPAFSTATDNQDRAFRKQITIAEMKKMKFWDICFIQDIQGDQFGSGYKPHQSGIRGGVQRSRQFNKDNVGNGVKVISNDEVRYHHPEYVQATGVGTSDDDMTKSWIDANNSFIKQFPAAFTYPWTVTNVSVYSCRFYIINSYDKIPEGGTANTPIANADFMNWLFIDDGFGNVINSDGVMYRYDFLFSGVMDYGGYIPGSNMFPGMETEVFKSSDEKYKYPNGVVTKKLRILNKKKIVS
jgi:hypothetical protein